MAVVALVVHPRRPHAAEHARAAASWLEGRGHTVRMAKEDADALGMAGHLGPADEVAGGVDLAVALGGDGTILRAVELVSDHGVPVLGVNLGRLGFLTAIEPGALTACLGRFLAGDHGIEDRMMLAVTVGRAGGPQETWTALNEAVVEKPSPGHTVHMAVAVGGRPWTTYAADGLIVATPTGSTAYSFSARGPILSPRLRALVMTPVSPHMPLDRSLVLDASETIRIEVTDDRPATLTVDGRELGLLGRGDAITCAAATRSARFVTFGNRDFYGIVKAKFGVADR